MTTNRPLKVFLCHSSADKPAVRELYQKLRAEPWIQPWLDEEELYPGQDWDLEIEKSVESSDVVIVCLSNNSIHKKGYVQKELRFALDIALEIPEESIFIIPLRLEECIPPRSLRDWQYADYFENQRDRSFERLLISLRKCADTKRKSSNGQLLSKQKYTSEGIPVDVLSNGMEFVRILAGSFLMGSAKDNKRGHDTERPQHTVDIPYDYWMARFPVTNSQFSYYALAKGIEHPILDWELKKDHPVAKVSKVTSLDYCQWLNTLLNNELPNGLLFRLPTEAEWEKAARGTNGYEYPWGHAFDKTRCNSHESGKASTTPIGFYSPQGDSPYGCADMAGNVWEWTNSLNKDYPYNASDGRESEPTVIRYRTILRGGSFTSYEGGVRCASRIVLGNVNLQVWVGFRICLAPPLPK